MKYLKLFNILNEEVSKNEPIPELYEKEKLGIILLGLPGSGKSTFIKNEIMTKNRNFKSFSTDYVSYMFTKSTSKFHPTSTNININYLKNYIETGQNFVYDTTGESEDLIREINKIATSNGYKIIFITMLIDKEEAKRRNILRGESGGHLVDDDYIDRVYSNQLERTKNYISDLNYDNFYIVLVKGRKYKYFKHTGSEILRHKVDRYVSRRSRLL
jgi:predicted ABC-type ATPase